MGAVHKFTKLSVIWNLLLLSREIQYYTPQVCLSKDLGVFVDQSLNFSTMFIMSSKKEHTLLFLRFFRIFLAVMQLFRNICAMLMSHLTQSIVAKLGVLTKKRCS